MARKSFFVFGFAAYMLPVVLALFGLGCWFEILSFLKRRWPWAVVLLLSCMGWLHPDGGALFTKAREGIGATSIGGLIGQELWENFFWMLGSVGAAIVYGALDFISLLFLTNFQLGEWLRSVWARWKGARSPPERRTGTARPASFRNRKSSRKRSNARASDADFKPVPEPTVRDLSVPQAKPGRAKKSAQPSRPKNPRPPTKARSFPPGGCRRHHRGHFGKKPNRPKAAEPRAGGQSDAPPPKGQPRREADARRTASSTSRRPPQAQARAPETQAHHRRLHADDWQLPASLAWISCSTPTRRSSRRNPKRS